MRVAHREWSVRNAELQTVLELRRQGARRTEELEQIIADLGEVPQLRQGRRLELEAEVKRAGNIERLLSAGRRALEALGAEEGVTAGLREVAAALQEMHRFDPSVESVITQFEAAQGALAEGELALHRYVADLDIDEPRLEQLRSELSTMARLERKYRVDDAGLVELLHSAQQELRQLTEGDGVAVLQKTVEELRVRMMTVGMELRRVRSGAAEELCRAVAADLAELNMGDAVLEVRFSPCEPQPSGIDRIEFLISTNRGEPAAALQKIASGGELSRVLLVLKKILRERSGVNVLIFDEVDTGISGGVARSVGQMLREIAGQSQVVCITHLPQVASLSDRHFLVQKEVGARAVTVVKQLSESEKVDEIARMLAGYTITEASRASARELIGAR
jgi:DNA repair protein RecN (Recombination protein N)